MTLFQSLEVAITTDLPDDSHAIHAVHEHGTGSFFVNDLATAKPVADILISNTPGLKLIHGFADCVPLIFFDPTNKSYVFAHAGWKGLTMGSVRITMLELAKHFDSREEDILVWIGPCIQKYSYHFSTEPLQACLPTWKEHIRKENDQYHIDLPGFVIAQCKSFGVPANHIENDGRDTYSDPNFPSHTAFKEGKEDKKGNFYISVTLI